VAARHHPSALLILAVVLLGMNLRTVIASLPPLLPTVRHALGISALFAGLLTTLPVVCFGVLALAGPRLARRIPMEQILLGCLALTAVAAGLRGVGGAAGLFAGSVLGGVAVGLAQAVLPILLRTRFPAAVGLLTGAYSMALPLGATVAGGISVPLAGWLGGSWRASLAIWGVPALLTGAVWLPSARGGAARLHTELPHPLWTDRAAWTVAGFFGCQSMAFYAGLSWLPAILQSDAWSASDAGWLQALASLVSVIPAFGVPALAARGHDRRRLLAGVVLAELIGVAGLVLLPGAAVLWMVVLGFGQGGALGLGLILPVLRGRGPAAVASLTAMSLSLGYIVAALGPWLLGAVHDAAGGWTVALWVLFGLTALQVPAGAAAIRPGAIGG
jgi:CP family cyanate transporter-like MFS transporter